MTPGSGPEPKIWPPPLGLRTHWCGALRTADAGATVTLCGWVDRRREHGEHLAFVDLRDYTGVVQCVVDGAHDLRSEYVLRVTGTVRDRPEGTANRVLGTFQGGGGKLEGGAGVVVEPPDQPRLDAVRDGQGVESGSNPGEVLPARLAQLVDHARGVRGRLAALGALAVEDAQGGVEGPMAMVVAEPVLALGEKGAQGGQVGRAADGVAEGVQKELDPPQADVRAHRPGQGHHLDIEVGVLAAEHLGAQLMVLAVTTGLRSLVAEVGGEVPGLPRNGRAVLDPRPHHRRRALGAEGEAVAALVRELVHLLADYVGALPHPGEDADVLEHGPDDQPVAGPFDSRGEPGHERLPPRRAGRQHVVGAGRGAERGHSGRVPARPLPSTARRRESPGRRRTRSRCA